MLLAVSEWDRRNIAAVEHVPLEGIRVLPNGIPPLSVTGHDLRAELGVPAGTGLIGAIGRLRPEKGHSDLLHALSLLKRSGAAFRS